MKLYRVRVEWETVILAESPEQAERLAPGIIRQEDDPVDFVRTAEMTSDNDLPPGWDKDCIPWGLRNNPSSKTIGQILKESHGL